MQSPLHAPQRWQRRIPARTTAAAWWQTRVWMSFLQDLLLVRSGCRYRLILDPRAPLGSTDPMHRVTRINPVGVAYPPRRWRHHIRHCPRNRVRFQQAVATAIVEHEACHIRDSGAKPTAATLAWLWNALEDGRIERRDVQATPRYALLGDVLLLSHTATSDLLAGCLLWRWQYDRPTMPRFIPKGADQHVWTTQIRPLVERAWRVPSSDEVTVIASQILKILNLPEDAPLPDTLPHGMCACGSARADHGSTNTPETGIPTSVPAAPDGSSIPGMPPAPGIGSGSHAEPLDPPQRDPAPLLPLIEGSARLLAAALRPPVLRQRTRPHSSRGYLNVERARSGHERPFDARHAEAPAPSCAVVLLVDESGSMGNADDPDDPIAGAIRMALCVDRAAELSHTPLGVWGFGDTALPIMIRPLGTSDHHLSQRRIAGMDGITNGTWLGPVFEKAVTTLAARSEAVRLLIVLHDGRITDTDSARVQTTVAALARHRIRVLPLYIGTDDEVIAANEAIFGSVLACADVVELTTLVCAWLRASLT